MEKIKNYCKLIRISHWIKNLFVIVPLFFSLKYTHLNYALLSLAGFLSFCFISSSIYCINDILDVEKDKLDAIKAKRPMAAGKVSKREGWFISFIFFFFAFFVLYLFNSNYFVYAIILFYFILNIFYSLILKNFFILDIMCISLGFVLRIYAGSKIINVSASSYLLLTTFFISLFLGFCKRKKELDRNIEPGKVRKVLASYSDKSLDYMIVASSIFSVMAYSLYTIADETVTKFGTTRLIYSIPFVVYGIFRYFYNIYREDNKTFSGDPSEIILSDKYIQIDVLLWGIFVLFIIS